jgi:hypothetical protein
MKLAVLVPDVHIPNHDIKAWKLFKKVLLSLKKDISEIVFLGDVCDFFSVNSHGSHPQVFNMLIDEVEIINKELDWFDQNFKRAKKVFIEGNHEHRLERYLLNKAPALFGVTEVKFLLNMNKRPNWKFCDYGPINHKVLVHCAGISKKEDFKTLIHELSHALIFRSGLAQIISGEAQEILCEALSHFIYENFNMRRSKRL